MKIPAAIPILQASVLWGRAALCEVNNPCYGPDLSAGVCITNTACTKSGGTYVKGGCPSDPAANIICCRKPSCSNGADGNCRWTSDCDGATVSKQCPGPTAFKCCDSANDGWGGYPDPRVPRVGACRHVAVDGATAIVAAFPGRIREVQCIAGKPCPCPTPGNEHCCGMATDLMNSDHPGDATISGYEIAEWVMDNAESLNLLYVIWGQRIWDPSKDKPNPWQQWRTMNNRGSITENHWDHVHVSYKQPPRRLEPDMNEL